MSNQNYSHNKSKNTGIQHFFDAASYSKAGLLSAFQNESAFRQELAVLLIGIPCAFIIANSASQFALLVTSLLIVLVVELLNSGIEAVIDWFGPEIHPLSKQAKDYGSAAVMLTLIASGIVWFGVIVDNYLL